MEDIRIYVEVDDAEKTYKDIREKSYLKEYKWKNHQIFTMALLIGKYVIDKREPLKSKKGFIRSESVEHKDEMDIFKCIAIEETEDVNLINDTKEIFEICEEYANSGIKELKKWCKDKDEFDNNISEVLLDYFEENKEIYLKYQD